MPDTLVPLPRDVNSLVGTGVKVISLPDLPSGGIVKTVRGEVGEHTTFVNEPKPTKSVENLVLVSDKGNWRLALGDLSDRTLAHTAVDADEDTLTITDHGMLTGDGPFTVSSSFQLPAGLGPQAASELLDLTGGNALNTETVVIDGKTYTFQTTLTDSDGNVQIGSDADETLDNLVAAITLGAGAGTAYAASTTLHPSVTAENNGDDTATVYAKTEGTAGNSIVISETLTNGNWDGAATNLSGGTASVNYWIIVVDDDTIKLATSKENAHVGTAVNITDQGNGTITLSGTSNLVEFPAADVLDGSGGFLLQVGQSVILPAHGPVTVQGFASDSVLTFFYS